MIAVATPKQIRELMKVDGLTNDEVKSHLQVSFFLSLSLSHKHTKQMYSEEKEVQQQNQETKKEEGMHERKKERKREID